MDYCSSCRRHLNGALVCPGCGAYAPDIAPAATSGHTTTALWPEQVATPDAGGYDGPDAYDESYEDESDGFGTDAPAAAAASQGVGRAARRRQKVRWKKSQRRAVVATAVALVGGGLTLASMDRGSGQGNQASAASDLSSMGAGESSVDTSADLPVTTPGTGKHRGPAADEAPTTGGHGSTRQQHAGTATAPHTDSAKPRSYTAANSKSTPTAEQQVTGTVKDTTSNTTGTVTKTTEPSSTTPTSNTGSGSGSSTSSGSTDTSQSGSGSGSTGSTGSGSTGSSSDSTSPSGLCVLNLLCVS